MLAIGRKVGQTLIIDETIRITVVSVSGKQVRLAIDAPTEVRVRRDELERHDEVYEMSENLNSEGR